MYSNSLVEYQRGTQHDETPRVMAPRLSVAIGSPTPDLRITSTVSAAISPCGIFAVLDTLSSPFDEDTISISPSTKTLSRITSSSAIKTQRRGFSSCSAPFDTLDLRSSSGSSPILGDLVNGARSRQSPAASPDRQKNSQASNAELGIRCFSGKSSSSMDVLQEEQRQNRKASNQTAQDEESPTKRCKVARSDEGNERYSMFISASDAEDSGEEDLRNSESGGEFVDVKIPKLAKRIIQEPKIKKAGQARRLSTTSTAVLDGIKIISDFDAWVQDQTIRKGHVGSLDPKEMYSYVRGLIVVEDKESDFTAAQVTLMILSLGSTHSIVNLKSIIHHMRNICQIRLVRPPAKIGKDKEKISELVKWVVSSTANGTELESFQARYYISGFCNYMISKRDKLMGMNGNENANAVLRQIYAQLIANAYPEIKRYHGKQNNTELEETEAFEAAVEVLEIKSKRGYHWLALRKVFGIGIMALYQYGELFKKTEHISLDDHHVSDEEFNLLMSYLSIKGNSHRVWLKLLCKKIEAHLSQGVKEILVMDELFVEKWAEEQIKACRERSDWLSMMCETRESMLMRPGNNVTLAAWSATNHKTRIAAWQKKVEQGVYREV